MSHAIEKPTDVTIPKTSLWAKLPLYAGLIGVIATGALVSQMFGEHKSRALFSYLFGFELFLAIALGALGFTIIQHLVRAGWSTVVRRIAETAMATLPVFLLLWIPIGALGMHELFPWTIEANVHGDEAMEAKTWFLTNGKFYLRAILYFAIWIGLSQYFYRRSLKQDGLSSSTERDAITRSMWKMAAAGIFLYGLSQSFQAIDWLMSLQPHWYSTMFGVYFFAGSMLAFYSFTALVAMSLQRAGVLKTAITTEHYHDLGKFIFGHTVFWAYIAFSQMMIQWYANIPEETKFFMDRVTGGWEIISYALPIVHFFVPFLFLLSRYIKRDRLGLTVGACWMLLVTVVDIYWLVLPNFGAHAHGEGGEHGAEAAHAAVPWALHLSWMDFAAVIGIGGIFLAVFSALLNRNKVVCVGDPRLEESLAHENY